MEGRRREQFRWVLLKERTARPLHRNLLCDALLALSGAKTEPAKKVREVRELGAGRHDLGNCKLGRVKLQSLESSLVVLKMTRKWWTMQFSKLLQRAPILDFCHSDKGPHSISNCYNYELEVWCVSGPGSGPERLHGLVVGRPG